MKELVILVTGWRWMSDRALMKRSLLAAAVGYNGDVIVWHGAATGADTVADIVAREIGWGVRRFPADWTRYRKAAGPIRNQHMVEELSRYDGPTVVLAFPKPGRSVGTMDCITRAIDAGHHVVIYPLKEDVHSGHSHAHTGRHGGTQKRPGRPPVAGSDGTDSGHRQDARAGDSGPDHVGGHGSSAPGRG